MEEYVTADDTMETLYVNS